MTRGSERSLALRCVVDCSQPHTHRLRVCLEVPAAAAVETFRLPVWIPGSYMVREFGRHLSGVRAQWVAADPMRKAASRGRQSCTVVQHDKTSWVVHRPEGATEGGLLQVEYEVYAFDTSVRTAFFSTERGFFNLTSVCLRREGWEAYPHRLQLQNLPDGWSVATAMDTGSDGGFEAPDYDAFVDHPVELGPFWSGTLRAGGVAHTFVVSGAWPGFDGKRLLRDTQAICQAHIDFWHGKGGRPPFKRYVFLLNVVEDGYGGLEHRASTALICGRKDLPRPEDTGLSEGYRTLLGLISHEYFHTWNVKRLKPLSLCTLDYQQENYTELLWFFEGFTSYYDDLALVRAGLVQGADYLQMLAKTATTVRSWPGRQVQTVAQASFDAWVKYYRQDENTPNATISYYTKGALVALCLDLTLRSEGRGTLDDVMRHLWRRGGTGRDPGSIGITEADILEALQQVGGRSYGRELQAWVHGTGDLPCADLLASVGVRVQTSPPTLAGRWGLRVSDSGTCVVKSVLRDSAAESAGVCAGDELLAINGWRVRRLEEASRWLAPKDTVAELVVSRDGRLHTLSLRRPSEAAVAPVYRWITDDSASEAAQQARSTWWRGAAVAR